MARLPHSSRRPFTLLFLLGLTGVALWCGFAVKSRLPGALPAGPPSAVSQPVADVTPEPERSSAPIPPASVSLQASATNTSIRPVENAAEAQKSAGQDLRAGRPFVMNEHGRSAKFRLALDEIYDATAPVHDRLRKISKQEGAGQLLNYAQAAAERLGRWPGLVIYPEDGPVDPAHRRVLTEQVLLKSQDAQAAEKLAAGAGLAITDRPAYSPEHLVAAAATPLAAVDAIAALGGRSEIASVEPLLMRQRLSKALLLDDTFFRDQWHLKNTGQVGGKIGIDIGLEALWNTDPLGLGQGQDIRIAIVDDGLQMNHPDLAANVDLAPNHYDWNGADTDPSPDTEHDFHGTAVSGIVAARGNNTLGVVGVAPQATLVGFRLIAGLVTDVTESESVTRGNNVIQVKNNSWGFPDGIPSELGGTSDLMLAAMANAATTGRGGLGTLSVWASGNGRSWGDQGNKDAYSNSIYGIAVGAVTNKGVLASYSETGSHLCVVAPSAETKAGMVTTDLTGVAGYNTGGLKDLFEVDYTNTFNGTSAAAPVVSGVVALMLQANPRLNWRDVKEILLRSSTKVQPKDSGWVEHPNRDPWEQTFQPVKHHHSYGGGLVHAPSAVRMAREWTGLGTMISETQSNIPVTPTSTNPRVKVTLTFPKEDEEKPDPKTKTTRLNVDFSELTAMRVEHVTVKVKATHSRRGDLTLRLISPSGTVSTLATATSKDKGADYADWIFSSVRHWGESSRGIWTVVASEIIDSMDGELGSVAVTLHGTSYPAVQLTESPDSSIVAEGSTTLLTGGVIGFGTPSHQWLKAAKPLPSATGPTLSLSPTQLTDAGVYTYTAHNLTGKVDATASLGVMRIQVPNQQLLPGRTAIFKVAAAGPDLRYQWYVGSQPLRDDDPATINRITGCRSPVLTIRQVSNLDAQDYTCRVSMGDLWQNTRPANLSIMIPPTLDPFRAPQPSIVSQLLDHPVLSENGATSYKVTGLPPGVKFDAKLHRLVGRPTKPGRYEITIIASNAAGSSDPVTFLWDVADIAEGTAGTYRGLIERNSLYNDGYGGAFTVTIAKTGTFSGSLTRGKVRSSFKGVLNTYRDETYATADFNLARPAPAPPLEISFSLDLGSLDGSIGRAEDDEYGTMSGMRQWTALPAPLSALPGLYNVPLVPQSPLSTHPRGSGYLSVTLTNKGRVSYTGRLADGTALTGAGIGIGEGTLPVHHMLYGNTGSVQGALDIITTLPGFKADLDWIKSLQPSTVRNYRNGFSRLALAGSGRRYTPPAADSLVLGLPLTSYNARLTISHGGLFIPLTQYFTLAAKNIPQFLPGENPQQLKLSLNAKTGLVTGSGAAIDATPRPGTASALIIPGLNRAEGYFLLPENTTNTSAILSGRFIMEPATGSSD